MDHSNLKWTSSITQLIRLGSELHTRRVCKDPKRDTRGELLHPGS